MLTFTSLSCPERSSAILSSTGETAWQGPHHSAQKSTRTGVSFEPSMTSSSNVVSVTSVVIRVKVLSRALTFETRHRNALFPLSRIESMPNVFAPLPPVPDHPALERDILELWEREGTFFKLVERNRGRP